MMAWNQRQQQQQQQQGSQSQSAGEQGGFGEQRHAGDATSVGGGRGVEAHEPLKEAQGKHSLADF